MGGQMYNKLREVGPLKQLPNLNVDKTCIII